MQTPFDLVALDHDPLVLAARHWAAGIERLQEDSLRIPEHLICKVRYEQLTSRPEECLRGILEFCSLPWNRRYAEFIRSFRIEDRNVKWRSEYSAVEVARIERAIGPTLKSLGYELATG